MHLVTITTNHDDHDNFHHDQSIIMIRFLNCEECLRGAKEATCGWCLDPDPNKLARSKIIMIMIMNNSGAVCYAAHALVLRACSRLDR